MSDLKNTPKKAAESATVKAVTLDAFTHEFDTNTPISRRTLQERTGFSIMTVHRAVDQLLTAELLTEKSAFDPLAGRVCRLLSPSPYPLMPIFDLSERNLTFRLADSASHIQAMVRYSYNDAFPAEDNLLLFLNQARPLMPAADVEQTPPIILLPPADDPRLSLTNTLRPQWDEPAYIEHTFEDVFDKTPYLLMDWYQAVLKASACHLPEDHTGGVLYMHIGDTLFADIAVSRDTNLLPDAPTSHALVLSRTLLEYINRPSETLAEAVGHFLHDCARFYCLNKVLVDIDGDGPAMVATIRQNQPELVGIDLYAPPADCPISTYGTALTARRKAWMEILEK